MTIVEFKEVAEYEATENNSGEIVRESWYWMDFEIVRHRRNGATVKNQYIIEDLCVNKEKFEYFLEFN